MNLLELYEIGKQLFPIDVSQTYFGYTKSGNIGACFSGCVYAGAVQQGLVEDDIHETAREIADYADGKSRDTRALSRVSLWLNEHFDNLHDIEATNDLESREEAARYARYLSEIREETQQ